jgi:hypothetical protein
MLVANGALSPSVPVVTVVHDSQIVDLPDSLFDIHDAAVDFIVTPTQVIQCKGAKPRPAGITWSLLAPERLDRLQILKRLRYREWKAGKDVRLAGDSEPPTELTDELPSADDKPGSGYLRRRTNFRRKPRKPASGDDEAAGDVDDEKKSSRIRDGEKIGERRGRGGSRVGTGFNRRFRRRGGPRREGGENRRTQSGGENERDGENEREDDREDGGVKTGSSGRRRRYGGQREGGNRGRRDTDNQVEDDEDGHNGEGSERRGGGRRRRSRRSESDGGGASAEGDNRRSGEGAGRGRRRFVRPGPRPYYGDCEGSVYVGALPKSLRVSEFKAEVRDRNVQPLRVVWRGASGYAFLGFKTVDDAEQALEALEGLHINEHGLRLEMAKSSGGRRRRRGPGRSGDSGGGDDHATSEDE